LLLVLAIGGAACGASGAMRAAERGDRAALKAELASREKAGSLSNAEAAKIARAVASRELAQAKDDAASRVRELRACANDVDDALAARMKTHDAAGAEAALARLDAGTLDASDVRAYVADPSDAWRAVGARGLVRSEDRPTRSRMIVDGAPEVRRAALRAAIAASDGADLDALAEAARVDPDPRARTEAVRGVAQIGGAAAVAKLRDLWTGADDAIREDIARAWSSPAVFAAGGRDELRVLVAAGHGPAAIDGAAAALRGGMNDKEIAAAATALLTRTIGDGSHGSHRDRLHAIAVVPRLSDDFAKALRDVAKDDDLTVRVGALARLTESAPDRAASIAALEALAGQAQMPAIASRAKLALASARDMRAQAWIEADLAAPDANARLSAASALAAMGHAGRGAPLLADEDVTVRMRAACTLMLAANNH